MLAYICSFCQPAPPMKLWEDHNIIVDLTLDYMQTDPKHVVINKALHDINAIFKQHGLSCTAIDLPTPVGRSTEVLGVCDTIEKAREGAERMVMLNINSVTHLTR